MTNDKLKRLLLAVCCFITAGLTLSAIMIQYMGSGGPDTGLRAGSAGMFRMFTNDGNIFSAAAALICGIYCIFRTSNSKSAARIVYCLRLMSAVSEIIIFIIVVAVLMPMGMRSLLSGYSMLVLHAVAPLITAVSFLALDPGPEDTGKRTFIYGGLPVLVYGVTVLILCLTKVWTGYMIPYPFFRVYDNPVWLTVAALAGIIGATLLLSFALDRIKRKQAGKE